jgi:hypothetical protein
MKTIAGWTTLSEQPLCLLREYSFGHGRSNSLLIELPNRKLLIVSPPVGLPEADLRALSDHGEVIALLAINGAHHLGLGPCRAVFPNAVTYAAPGARDRIRKRGKDFGELKPLDALAPLLGDHIRLQEIEGVKFGDVVLHAVTERGNLFYASDFFANIPKLPNILIKLLFSLSGSGPGLKVFRLYFLGFVRKRAAARDHLIRELQAHPPAIMVPAHGDVAQQPDLGSTLVSMLRAF